MDEDGAPAKAQESENGGWTVESSSFPFRAASRTNSEKAKLRQISYAEVHKNEITPGVYYFAIFMFSNSSLPCWVCRLSPISHKQVFPDEEDRKDSIYQLSRAEAQRTEVWKTGLNDITVGSIAFSF